jgi:SAM-dependent methyltransferase
LSAPPRRSFDELVDEASSAPIAGWDFTFLQGRTEGQPLPWDYQQVAAGLVAGARRVLDVDTGGGEVFSSLRPPQGSVAVEPHHPNLTIAARRLQPLGVEVVERLTDLLPVADTTFDLVLNRHGYLNAPEVHRVLSPEGRLLSQQVGARNDVELNEALGIPAAADPTTPSSVASLRDDLGRAGFVACDVREATIVTRFLDVGAVIFQLRAVSWQAPGFDIARHREQLERIHDQIVRTGGFEVRSQRFLIQAEKPI